MPVSIIVLVATLSIFFGANPGTNASPPTVNDVGGGIPTATATPSVDDVGGGIPTH